MTEAGVRAKKRARSALDDVDAKIRRALESEAIVKEAFYQTGQFLLKQNHISVLFPLRSALLGAQSIYSITPGSELVFYLHELTVKTLATIPADRGHAMLAHTTVQKFNTDYSVTQTSLVGADAQKFVNNEVLAGIDVTTNWQRNTDFNCVAVAPHRKISADANLRSGYKRENYLFGKGASVSGNHFMTLTRPRAEDTGVLGKRDYTILSSTVMYSSNKNNSLKIKIRRNLNGSFVFSHDFWLVVRADDEPRTVSTDDVLKYENTYYCKFSAKE